MNKIFILKGLDCANCSAKIENDVNKMQDVKTAAINLLKQTITIESDAEIEGLKDKLEKIVHRYEPDVDVFDFADDHDDDCHEHEHHHGDCCDHDDCHEDHHFGEHLECSCGCHDHEHGHEHHHDEKNEFKSMLTRLITGAAIYVAVIIATHLLDLPWYVDLIAFIVPYVILGYDVVLHALNNIVRGRVFDEQFLMSLSSIAAFFIGEYPEAVAVMLFYQIGEFLQDMAVDHSRRNIASLMDIRPDSANIYKDGEMVSVAAKSVKVGDIIAVKPGERIPLDGFVVKGDSMLDMRALTGESVPKRIRTGETALSGSINETGLLEIKVTKVFGESTVSKIIDMVENASARKAKTENFVTKFARYYTPIVVILALCLALLPPLLLGLSWSDWITRAIVCLVVSCPCAVVISVPLAFFGGIGAASKRGVLVKGSNYLEALNSIKTVVFDKTGTLTKGVFRVNEILPAKDMTSEEVIEYAALAESFSNHPIAISIINEFESLGKNLEVSKASDYKEIAGKGISVKVSESGKTRDLLVGNEKLMSENNIDYMPSELVGTKIYLALDGKYLGLILISDEIKEDAKAAVLGLKEMGIEKCVMLTGDENKIANYVANVIDMDEYHAELLPGDKVDIVEKLSEKSLAFVGDGINDAPVLARADVGIAMGGVGSDAAIEAADIVIMTDEPSKIVDAIDVAKSTRRIVVENIVLALGVKFAFIVLGSVGIAGMWSAVFGDVGVALLACLNSMRLLRK